MAYIFRCRMCNYQRVHDDIVLRYYESPVGRLPVCEWPCWCDECGDVSLAEHIPSQEEILREGKAWVRRDTEFRYILTGGPCPYGTSKHEDDRRERESLERLDRTMVWRKMRTSPAKCLFCHTTSVKLVKNLTTHFEHPECGGMFEAILFTSGVNGWFPTETYNVEGDLIRTAYERG